MLRCALVATAFLLIAATGAFSAPLELVADGATDYVIYYADQAPASVRMAAAELRSYIEKSTGVRLDIVNEPGNPMICLGDNLSGFFSLVPEQALSVRATQ